MKQLKDWVLDLFPAIVVVVLLVTLLLVTGCSSKPEPAIKIVTQQVYVPKMVFCLDKADVPEYNLVVKTKINKNDNAFVKTKKLIQRDKEHQQYANLVQPLLKVCVGEGENK